MNKLGFLVFFLVVSFGVNAQLKQSSTGIDSYPVFETCDTLKEYKECFGVTLLQKIKEDFRFPETLDSLSYKANMRLFFEVTEKGKFRVLYADIESVVMRDEMIRVFDAMPIVKPATYNGMPAYIQFNVTLSYPFPETWGAASKEKDNSIVVGKFNEFEKLTKANNYDSIKTLPYTNKEFHSSLNIPFQYQRYALFDPAMNAVSANSHTASKPFLFNDVQGYFDYEGYTKSLQQDRRTWFGKKFWNEHFASIIAEDYWISFDIAADLRTGKDSYSGKSTYNNTRAFQFQGGLGKNLTFYTIFYESQGRFASYYNDYAESIAPDGGNPAIIPGRGIAKRFKEDSYDYPVAEAYLSYSVNKTFNAQFGFGKNFIGDGYRSLLTSDVASPYPFLKLNTTFWKLKYTNTFMWLKDVRTEVTEDGAYLTKYMANHYLSWNVTKRWNLGLFESVIWKDDNNRGFDVGYLNPLIFYRAIEFYSGSRSGNALIGLTSKYKFTDRFNMYGQLILDELSTSDITGGEKSWKNKYGFQIGGKYYHAFGVKNLLLQMEYNQVRPYTYSHEHVEYNYGHNNQSMAHLWGANFKELIGIVNYSYNRWFGYGKFTYGERGLDFNTSEDSNSYGGDIYRSYEDRIGDKGIATLQGNKTHIFIAELQAGYVVNPVTNLRIFGNVLLRNYNPTADTEATFKQYTTWFTLGFRTDLFNWYNDF